MNAQKGTAVVKFYIPEDAQENIDIVREGLMDYGRADFTLVEDDWSEAWKEHYKPFKIGERVVVVPAWEDYTPGDDDEIVFRIEPGHVFGTGQHQSTALCVAALEKYVIAGDAVLDIGCGSGILSIISLLYSAHSATAIDIDPSAAKVCLENARLNDISDEKFKIHIGNILADDALLQEVSRRKYDVVVANIIADVIIPLAPIVKQLLIGGGTFITGGIIKDRRDDVLGALSENGFDVKEVCVQDEWVAVVAKYEA